MNFSQLLSLCQVYNHEEFSPQRCNCWKSTFPLEALISLLSSAEARERTLREALDKLQARANELHSWVACSNAQESQKHLDEDTPERTYWHYGYMVALVDVIRLLNSSRSDDGRAEASAGNP